MPNLSPPHTIESKRTMFGACMWSGTCNGQPGVILSYYFAWHDLWCFTDGEWKLIYHADGAPALIRRLKEDVIETMPEYN